MKDEGVEYLSSSSFSFELEVNTDICEKALLNKNSLNPRNIIIYLNIPII